MNRFGILIICTLCCYTSCLFSQTKTIKYIDTEISIDGKLDESVWQQLPEYTGFYNYAPNDEGLAEQQTEVKLFHNGEYLYVSVVYFDTEERSQVSSLKRDIPIGLSDGFAMILDTQNQEQNAYYFSVNAFGTIIDGLVEKVNGGYDFTTSWNAVWQAKTSTENKNKMYEVAIPLKALNFNAGSTIFGIQFYTRDIKKNSWTILKNVKRNYRLFDLRFTEKFSIDNLPNKSSSKFSVTPSLTVNYQNDAIEDADETTFKPSLDAQYNLTSSLKLDATINPDFSQIDVDQQVTNLSRFSIFFPERRNFFLENSDLFSSLGIYNANPFYSRRIGADSDIQFGLKLSGNIAPKTRIGVLNAQTEDDNDIASQNYGVVVVEQQLTKNFTTTGYVINRQKTDKFNFEDDYNRVTGINLNYKSDNNKWIGLVNYSKSFSDGISDNNNFYNAGIWFNKRGLNWNTSIVKLEENYITDVGFTPRLYNYDAINDVVVREGYLQTSSGIEYEKFYEKSKILNSIRFANYGINNYFDEQGKLTQSQNFFNSAVFFKNLSAVYFVVNYDYIDLKYGFDPFGMPMPGRQTMGGETYRYAFQGQEKDPETGKEAFELRLWDSRIGRWLSPDPYAQFSSPYLGMGNNPMNGIDPDGGCWDSEGNPCADGVLGDTTLDGQGNTWTFGENGWDTNAYDAYEVNVGTAYNSRFQFNWNFRLKDPFPNSKWDWFEDRVSGPTVWGNGDNDLGNLRGKNSFIDGSFRGDDLPQLGGGGGKIPFWKHKQNYRSIFFRTLKKGVSAKDKIDNVESILFPPSSKIILNKQIEIQHKTHIYTIYFDTKSYDSVPIIFNVKGQDSIIVQRKADSIDAIYNGRRNTAKTYFDN